MRIHRNRQQGSALIIALVLSMALLLIMQAATTQVYIFDEQVEFMEKKHNKDFRERHPKKAVEPTDAEEDRTQSERSSAE